ncbi:coiled-coil domain-containing 147 [Gorgonomyces haynaldii]|nr:coiled-coil domain-containing 147 [Gorgonomyces haynaldii]
MEEAPKSPLPQDEDVKAFEDEMSAEDILGTMLKKDEDDFKLPEDEVAPPTDILAEVQNTLDHLSTEGGQNASAILKLKDEYDKLNKILIESRKNESMLIKKCKDMTAELSANARKIQTAIKLSQTDRNTIASLQKEVKRAWKQVEANAEKENRNKELIASLKFELEGIKGGAAKHDGQEQHQSGPMTRHKLIELQQEQEEELRKTTKMLHELESEHQNVVQELKEVKQDNEEKEEKIKILKEEKQVMDEEMLTLKDFLASKKTEQDRDQRLREKLESSLKQINDAVDKKEEELKAKILEARALKDNLNKIEGQFKNEQFRAEKLEKDKDALVMRVNRLQQDFDDRDLENQKLANQAHETKRLLEAREDELSRTKETLKQLNRAKESLSKKQRQVEEVRMQVELERDSLRSNNAHLNHDVDVYKKEIESLQKQLEMVSRERDLSQKNLIKTTTATQKQYNIIYTLEKERDNRINESSRLEQVLAQQEEDMKLKDMIIFDSKKKIIEFEKKLKEQQAPLADRNVYSKNLVESKDEIDEMKRKVKIMDHQVDQLKEEIASKEAEKEKEVLSTQISKLQQQLDEANQLVQNQEAEENKLRHIILEADAERVRQKKEYDAVIHERDILGTQLIRRNDELSLLYEKIRIQTSTLNKGEIQYRERLEDIRVLRLEIKRLRRERAILQTETQNVESLRNEIFKLQRDVLRERTRVKVLEEELESPMNIHRWRKLAGSDPSTFELISKIQTLQKRLIAKTEEVVEKELLIQQKEKLYNDIKQVLQRQPGPEVMEELQVVRQAVKTKNKEAKALASELNMYHSQVNEYKYEIDRLNRELQEMKKKYYRIRKKSPERKPYNDVPAEVIPT